MAQNQVCRYTWAFGAIASDVFVIAPHLCALKKKKKKKNQIQLLIDGNSPRGFYVVAHRTASSHKCNIVTNANCAEAGVTFLMAYAHIWAESD